ncbi:MAG TPA: hypothetical protein VNK52_12595 [Hyphomicrobiaceae bacterium]|nr:hypothetical protein [Hyphomicrobiaceae bacterium]
MPARTVLAAAAATAFTLACASPAPALEIDRGTFWRGDGPDPYAYYYEPPGYYPYVNSGQWRPAQEMRGRYRYPLWLPEYYSSWGYPLPCDHVAGGCRASPWRR